MTSCKHPDHVSDKTCEDRAGGCHKSCLCCMGPHLVATYEYQCILGPDMDTLRNEDFDEAHFHRYDDWRAHVPQTVRDLWQHLDDYSRIAIVLTAHEASRLVPYDQRCD